MATRIYLQKNDLSKNAKLPYFTLKLVPETDGEDWVEIGALWKAKSGNGYSGQLSDGVGITVSGETDSDTKSLDEIAQQSDAD